MLELKLTTHSVRRGTSKAANPGHPGEVNRTATGQASLGALCPRQKHQACAQASVGAGVWWGAVREWGTKCI